jgi:hypothetical protein
MNAIGFNILTWYGLCSECIVTPVVYGNDLLLHAALIYAKYVSE